MTDKQATYAYERRIDADLAGDFAKDLESEDFLERFNAQLAPHADAGYRELDESAPTLHVIGVPRSGTTLLHQAIVSRLDVGYIDNLVAAFWRAPTYGLQLSMKLGLAHDGSDFASSFGRTSGVGEPHEFGYFWNDHLRYPDMTQQDGAHDATIDWTYLRRVLLNMAEVCGKPMVFKPMLLLWHLEAMLREMPLTCYVWIRRETRQVALSLLKMRELMFGSVERWASLRPMDAVALGGDDPVAQVVAQTLVLERTIAQATESMGPSHVLEVGHPELCEAPDQVVVRVREILESKGADIADHGSSLAPFEVRRNDQLEARYGERVDQAIESVRGRLGATPSGIDGGQR